MIPEYLKNKLLTEYDKNIVDEIIACYKTPRITSIRINTLKSTIKEIKEVLKENGIEFKLVEWSDFSLIIVNTSEEELRKLSIYQEGKIYLQSLSSQLPPLFLNPKPNETILDMTAAPGGKTTEIAALSNNQAMITATEKNKQRYERLKYNIAKQGATKVTVLNIDARNLDEYFTFDKILLDAPCSGSGTLYGKSLNDFNEDLVNRSIKFQKELINEAIKHLKLNGELIYSTCSILKEENENIINEILQAHPELVLIPLDIVNYQELPLLPVKIEGTLCLKPTIFYEGFFVAKLKKIK